MVNSLLFYSYSSLFSLVFTIFDSCLGLSVFSCSAISPLARDHVNGMFGSHLIPKFNISLFLYPKLEHLWEWFLHADPDHQRVKWNLVLVELTQKSHKNEIEFSLIPTRHHVSMRRAACEKHREAVITSNKALVSVVIESIASAPHFKSLHINHNENETCDRECLRT